MDARRYKDIVGLRTQKGRVLGFHARNIEVAELSSELWSAFNSPSSPLVTELEQWNNESSTDVSDLQKANGFRTFSLNIAQVCNLKCDYCAAGGDGTYGSATAKIKLERAFEQIKFFLKSVPSGDTFNLHFIGGEPLLFPNAIEQIMFFARLYVAGRNIQLNFSITTNGTLITEQVAKLLARMNAHVTVSLDGPAQYNDKIRKTKNKKSSTQQTILGLQALQKVKSKLRGISINSVFGDHYVKVVETYDFLTSLNVDIDSYNFNYAVNKQDQVYSDIYLEQMQQVAEKAYQKEGLKELTKIIQFCEPMKRIASQTRKKDYCAAGKSLIKTDTNGDLHVCNWFMNDENEKVGHGTQLISEALKSYESSLIELNNCNSCWARFVCGGGCMYVNKYKTGDKHGKDPYFCNRSRSLLAMAIEYYTNDLING